MNDVLCDLLFSKVADHPELGVFLLMLQQLGHCVTQVKQHVTVRCEEEAHMQSADSIH